jgi:hemolysin III
MEKRERTTRGIPISERVVYKPCTAPNFPTPDAKQRRTDLYVHLIAHLAILVGGGVLIWHIQMTHGTAVQISIWVYALCALGSNLASMRYHFSPRHGARVHLRRLDHAAIYPSITGSFTPLLVMIGTAFSLGILALCWGFSLLGIWLKLTSAEVKSRWSTASYLGLGALSLTALPLLPSKTLWWVLVSSCMYLIGVSIYTRKSLPYRYALWHSCCNLGGVAMFVGIWQALF